MSWLVFSQIPFVEPHVNLNHPFRHYVFGLSNYANLSVVPDTIIQTKLSAAANCFSYARQHPGKVTGV